MTPQELPAYLTAIRERVAASMVPVCDAIGDAYRDHLVDVTLTESGAHGPATADGYPPSAPEGRPPMEMTGNLRNTIVKTPALGGAGIAECSVFPTVIYARTIQWGDTHRGAPLMALWVKYVGYPTVKRKNWLKETVNIGSRPYMDVAVAETFADGELSHAAEAKFMETVWGG